MLETLQELPVARELIVIIIAALPIFELRGAIPVAINTFNFTWYYAFLLALIGNLLPVPVVLLFMNSVVRLLSRFTIFRRFFAWVFQRTQRNYRRMQKYETIGLTLFVSVPLPVTGAWTGSIAAVLLGIPFKRSFVAIALGVVIAGVIVTCLSLLGWLGAILAGLGLLLAVAFGLWRW